VELSARLSTSQNPLAACWRPSCALPLLLPALLPLLSAWLAALLGEILPGIATRVSTAPGPLSAATAGATWALKRGARGDARLLGGSSSLVRPSGRGVISSSVAWEPLRDTLQQHIEAPLASPSGQTTAGGMSKSSLERILRLCYCS
jgi:hypothetical protein